MKEKNLQTTQKVDRKGNAYTFDTKEELELIERTMSLKEKHLYIIRTIGINLKTL